MGSGPPHTLAEHGCSTGEVGVVAGTVQKGSPDRHPLAQGDEALVGPAVLPGVAVALALEALGLADLHQLGVEKVGLPLDIDRLRDRYGKRPGEHLGMEQPLWRGLLWGLGMGGNRRKRRKRWLNAAAVGV